jgi:hypothetical protein
VVDDPGAVVIDSGAGEVVEVVAEPAVVDVAGELDDERDSPWPHAAAAGTAASAATTSPRRRT